MVSRDQQLVNTIVERLIDTHEEVKKMYCMIDGEMDDDTGYAHLVDSAYNASQCAYDKALAVKKATKDD
jgi:hypothetical protein